PPAGADPFAEDRQAFRPAEDEVLRAARLMVLPVDLLDLLESAHRRRVPEGRTGKLDRSVATKEAPPADVAAPGDRETTGAPITGDIRRSRPYLLASTPLRNLLFRGASVVALVAIDLVAVGFALYAALAIREVYYGHSPILWGVLWTAEGKWLPF